MFEHALMKRRGGRRRGWILALAVAVHGAAFATVVLASAWNVDAVAPPMENATFMRPIDVTHIVFEEPRQEPPAPPPQEPPPPAPVEREPAPAQPAPPPVQPTTVPENAPTTPAVPELEPASGGGDTPANGPTEGGGTDPNAPAWGPGEGDVPVALDARMTRPETIFRVQPRYTERARIAGREGIVVLRATIDRTGAVTDVRLVKPLGLGLDESAIGAVRQWRFTPAAMNGRPVPVFFQLTVTFSIR